MGSRSSRSNDTDNVTEPLQGNGAVPGFAALRSSSKLKQLPNDQFERRHPEIELAQQEELFLQLER